MVHSNSNCLTGVNKFLKRNPCQGCFTDTSAYQRPCVVFCHKKPWKFTAAASACWFQLWFYLAWLLLLWFAWVPLENAGAMMFVEKAAVAAVPAWSVEGSGVHRMAVAFFAWHISEQKALGTKVVYLSKHSGPLCKHSAKLTAETGPLNAGQLWLYPLPHRLNAFWF